MIADIRNSGFWKMAEYLTYAFFVIFPFVTFKNFLYAGTSFRSILLAYLATILGIGFSIWIYKRKTLVSVVKSPIFIALLLYLISTSISGFFGMDPSMSFWSSAARTTGIWYFLNLGSVMLIWFNLFNDSRILKNTVRTIVYPAAIYSLLSLLGPEGLGWLFNDFTWDGFTFGNSSFAGMYIFASFMLSIYLAVTSRARRWWTYAAPVALAINPFILSRGIWFGNFSELVGEARSSAYVLLFSVLALLFAYFVSKLKSEVVRRKVAWGVFALSLFVASLASFSLLSEHGYLRKAYLAQATAARPLVWQMSSEAISQRPFFGWGGDNFERVFEVNYDNRLLEDRYGSESWFDRAHNIFIDQAVDNGYVGLSLYLLVYLVATLSLIFVITRSKDSETKVLAVVLATYFPLHFAEVQTAFDTSISYPILAFMAVLSAVLFDQTWRDEKSETKIPLNIAASKLFALAVAAFFIWAFLAGLYPYTKAQLANGYMRTIGSTEKRIPVYGNLLGSPVDQHSFLWRMSTDFQRGIAKDVSILENKKTLESLRKEAVILEEAYREFVEKNPTHFRARLNLADILIFQNFLGVNKISEAQVVLDRAIPLVPHSPQTYWMKAVSYLYMGKFEDAKLYSNKALELNPDIGESKKVASYIESSIKSFPNVRFYFFPEI